MFGLIAGAFLFTLFALLGERIYLSWLESRALGLSEKRLFNRFKNFCYLLRIKKAQIYTTAFEPHAFLCFQSPFTKQRIIVLGQALIEQMKEEELDALVLHALKKLKKGEFSQIFNYSLFFLPYSLVLMFCEAYIKSEKLNTLVGFFFFPLTYLKSLFLSIVRKKVDSVTSLDVGEMSHFLVAGLNNYKSFQSKVEMQKNKREFLGNFALACAQESQRNVLDKKISDTTLAQSL